MHETSLSIWIGFVGFILFVLALDLGVFHKKSHNVGFREAILWSVVWIVLAMVFSLILLQWRGEQDFKLFITGYVIEKSLSIDNLFVFLLIFSYFKIPNQYQHKILFYGIIGALIMRALFIWGGIAIIRQFSWAIYIFGGFLILTGIKMLIPQESEPTLENNKIIALTKKIFPTSHDLDGDRFFTMEGTRKLVTPLFVALVFVEISDVVFAVDSIPAIIGITDDPFLVFTSNVFAILGLRSLYFALKGFSDVFHYLKYGLAVILMFIGFKMCASHWFHVPVWFTMAFIFAVLLTSMLISLLFKEKISTNS